MEIGLMNDVPTYAGGLGILAGDTLRSGADLNLPLVAVTMISKKGYFQQEIDDQGRQIELPDQWEASRLLKPLPQVAEVALEGRVVKVRSWIYRLRSLTGGEVPVLFLDTDLEENSPEDRRITDHLYGGDERYRLKQELVLGIGGVRMLHLLGFKIRKYHLNEGHSSLLALELLRRRDMDIEAVKEMCIFTTHTPVEAAHDKFAYSVVEDVIRDLQEVELLRRFGGTDRLNMTLLALNLSNYINGVGKRHREVGMAMFPGYKIHAVTNGVHSYTWTCPCLRALYDKYMPGWANEPEMLTRVGGIPDEEIWQQHLKAKKTLFDYAKRDSGVEMDPEIFTIGSARRVTAYKRPMLIFSDIERLRKINRQGILQIVLAGKAHPNDHAGKQAIAEIFGHIENLEDEIGIAFLKNYNIKTAGLLTSGVDLWLNTPLPPYEASGTSGMKAAHNGVVNFSVLDGWWIEGWIEGVTGWSIGPEPDEDISSDEARVQEQEDLYNKLRYIIKPMFYQRRDDWINMMNNSIGMVAYYFNSHRMMRRYVTEAYL
ncbi:MAG: alpha-glucan family phosphorylase [Methanotrichaceae archaeon]|nr:alpha-glucan family phosphorylase [Methanotrichaceae archaeon]